MNYVKTAMLLAALTAIFMLLGRLIAGPGGMWIGLLIAAATNLFAWWRSDKAVLRMHGAREVGPREAPELHEMVSLLAKNAGLPTPKVYVIESDQPNAFATGRNPENAAVAVTTGIMRRLSREELAGVIAHELAHIQNRDTLIMTIAATVAGAISMGARFGLMTGGGQSRERGGGFLTIIAVLLAPFAAMLIQMFISRTREYAADRRGAEICGEPMWLASALAKIGGMAARLPMRTAEQNPASAHLFIVNPLAGGGRDSLFSTHPSMENRITALEQMAHEGGFRQAARGADTVWRR